MSLSVIGLITASKSSFFFAVLTLAFFRHVFPNRAFQAIDVNVLKDLYIFLFLLIF